LVSTSIHCSIMCRVDEAVDCRHCSRCKKPRRATKTLSIARLPPVLLIHFKRFMARQGGLFFDKSETPVIFPATPQTPLDLTRWMPQDPPGTGRPSDPMQMRGPYRYELFAVSNHMGNLSNGHCELIFPVHCHHIRLIFVSLRHRFR
jgi:ubiquitin carboxyl-terminal hydrolase 8